MTSVASAGTTDRIVARILASAPRAGSGTLAKYSSTLFGGSLPLEAEPRFAAPTLFVEEPRLRDLTFFIRLARIMPEGEANEHRKKRLSECNFSRPLVTDLSRNKLK